MEGQDQQQQQEQPAKANPLRSLAQAIVGVSDYVEAKGGTPEDRIDAIEGLLQSIDDDDDGAAG